MTVSISPGALAFGKVAIGDTVELSLTVSNAGEFDATITDISGTTTFVSDLASSTVAAHSSTTIHYQFTPVSTGSDSSEMSVAWTQQVGNVWAFTHHNVSCQLSGSGVELSYSTTAVDFGTIAYGASSGTQTVTISNPSAHAVSLQDPGGNFTITAVDGVAVALPYAIAAGAIVTVTVQYDANSYGSSTGRIKTGSAYDSGCALTGNCTSTVDTDEVSDTDGLEVETYSSGGDKTYLLLEVQDFNADGADQQVNAVTCSGGLNSYLWMGAPGTSYASRRGEDFANLVSYSDDGDDTNDTLFVDDTRARSDGEYETAKEANSGIPAASSNTKDISTGDPYYRLSQSQRTTETGKLHTRGGWRDHTDGNRITTTRGDKVEVIGGNYKLIIMGRRQWTGGTATVNADNALNWESSGAITSHYDFIPGQVVDIRWVKDLDGVFRVKEQTTRGNVVERYDGMKKEWYYGTTIQSRVSSIDVYDSYVDSAADLPTIFSAKELAAGVATDNVSADGFPLCTEFDQTSDEAHQTGDWPPTDKYDRTDYQAGSGTASVSSYGQFAGYAPNIKETTWANRTADREWCRKIVKRVGSSNRYIPTIIENDYADHITETLHVHDYTKTIRVKKRGGSGKFEDTITTTKGGTIKENRAARYTGYSQGRDLELWGVGTGKHFLINFAEIFAGSHESVRAPASLALFYGVSIDLHPLQPLTFTMELVSNLVRMQTFGVHIEIIAGAESTVAGVEQKFTLGFRQVFMLCDNRAFLRDDITGSPC